MAPKKVVTLLENGVQVCCNCLKLLDSPTHIRVGK
jgi:hypothetical protein